eukprot:ANDGO_08050.mRNA.1 Dynein light chain Tctex-type
MDGLDMLGVKSAPAATHGTDSQFRIRPQFDDKFRASQVKALLQEVLATKLSGVEYQVDAASTLTKEIADVIRDKTKGFEYERYKIIAQVVVGERKGEGVRLGCRCFWDSDSDAFAEHLYMNDSLFCLATVYGIYQY